MAASHYLLAYYNSRALACHLISSIYTEVYHVTKYISLTLKFRAHKRKRERDKGQGLQERFTKVYSFKTSFLTSNIYLNRDVAVIPSG